MFASLASNCHGASHQKVRSSILHVRHQVGSRWSSNRHTSDVAPFGHWIGPNVRSRAPSPPTVVMLSSSRKHPGMETLVQTLSKTSNFSCGNLLAMHTTCLHHPKYTTRKQTNDLVTEECWVGWTGEKPTAVSPVCYKTELQSHLISQVSFMDKRIFY